MFRSLIFLILAFISLPCFAWAEDFSVTAPATWVQVKTSHSGQLFQNSKNKSLVLIYTRDVSANHLAPEKLIEIARSISNEREEKLLSVGIRNYSILSMERVRLSSAKGNPAVQLESRYLNYRFLPVQMIERQYFAKGKIYFVVYSEESAAITNRGQVASLMDQFVPKISASRNPASETVGAKNVLPPPSTSAEETLRAQAEKYEFKPALLDPKSSQCAKVPEEKRRKESDSGVIAQANYGLGCIKGAFYAVPGFVEHAWEAGTGAAGAVADAAVGTYSYVTDSAYRAETNASAVVAFEALKDPEAIVVKIDRAITEYIAGQLNYFGCLSNEARGEVVCQFVGELAMGGTLLKFLKPIFNGGKAFLVDNGGVFLEKAVDKVFGAKKAEEERKRLAAIEEERKRLADGERAKVAATNRETARAEEAKKEKLNEIWTDYRAANPPSRPKVYKWKVSESQESRASRKASPQEFESPSDANSPSPSQLAYSDLKPISGRALNSVESALKSKKISSEAKLDGGSPDNKVVWLAGGNKAVWKPHNEKSFTSNYRAEVLAYEIDQKLGFDLVPPTVEREIGGKKGSMQLFVTTPRGALSPSELAQSKQSIFDYIIDNRDRHSGNYFVKSDGSTISIDNATSFTGKGVHPVDWRERKGHIEYYLQSTESRGVVSKIRSSMNDSKFKSELVDYLGEADANRVIERMQKVIEVDTELQKRTAHP